MESTLLRQEKLSPDLSFQVIQGDITRQEVDAIVNAANDRLRHGGGVAGVISRSGGPVIQRESSAWVREHGPVTHARPAYTSAGDLPCRYVIHAVGPVWGSGEEDRKLAAAVRGSLRRADELSLRSIALPAISTGIFGYPMERAARVIYRAVREYASQNPESELESIRLVLYGDQAVSAFLSAWDRD